MGSSLPERPQSSRLSSIGPESEQSLLSQHRRVVEEKELEYNSCYMTAFSKLSICSTLWEPVPSYFHLVGSPLPSSPLGQELHWGSRSRPHTS